VNRLTRAEGVTYTEYIEWLALDLDAVVIKLADLRDNNDLWRVTSKTGLYSRHAKAYYYLTKGEWPK